MDWIKAITEVFQTLLSWISLVGIRTENGIALTGEGKKAVA